MNACQNVFDQLNREIWVLTADAGEAARDLPQSRGGLVATWAGPASIDPERPTAMVAVATNHFTHELICRSRAFGLHLIRADQRDLVWRFALSSGFEEDKLAGLAIHLEKTGSPILDDCHAWLDCRVYDSYTAGDRCFFWADVVAGELLGEGEPLRTKELFSSADVARSTQVFGRMLSDIEVQRPLFAKWRDSLPAD